MRKSKKSKLQPEEVTLYTKIDSIEQNEVDQYQNNGPFNHIVFDNFLQDQDYINDVITEFDQYTQWGHDSSEYSEKNQVKKFFSPWNDENITDIPPKTKKLIDHFNSDEFIKKIENLTGITGLIADPTLTGGGMHKINSGGKLSVHADSSKHTKTGLYRRVNLLLYLNEDWQESWGGTLQLWDKTLTEMGAEIQPVSNRAVLFSTTKDSYHGHPHALNTPPDVSRHSIALYYYSEDMPDDQKAEFDSAQWVQIPEDTKDVAEVQTLERPTLAFATMCKNEEHIIGTVLDAVAPYIDYLIVADTGSTDNTIKIVEEFMERTGIPGEVHVDEWYGFDKNKNIMMGYAFDKSDYVLHLDADDILAGEFNFTLDDAGYDNYLMTMKRGTSTWKATVIYDNRVHWKFCGVAHTIIKCLERPYVRTGDLSDRGWVIADGVGSRAFDPKKYLYDAERLEKQFFDTLVDDPDGLNTRSVFYTAQSYMDYGMYEKALEWNSLYQKIENTWIEEKFESQMRISRCMMTLPKKYSVQRVINEMEKAIAIFDDRAEPYYNLGKHLNHIGMHEQAYYYLTKAKSVSLEKAQEKYILFVSVTCYNEYVNDELSVSCYYLNKIEQGISLIEEIINDPKFEAQRARISKNLELFENLKKGQQETEKQDA
jgi:Rps23 Pro-64 3,4-dihydroxylase Tpa1-like proline 4-hydroxylase/glycosyltransferase involved in cell wall biosynthesis